jgi:NAD+ synthetase
VEPQAGVVFEAERFSEAIRTLIFNDGHFCEASGACLPPSSDEGLPAMEFYRRQIVLGLRDYARRCGFTRAVVGSSGGIDSALTLALAAEALGAENVVGITMPSKFSSAGSVDDSVTLCRNLGVRLIEHPIRDLVATYGAGFSAAFSAPLQGLPLENLQARVRGTILMEYSNAFGHLLLTTGNKSEISVGYCTLYGDTNGGLGLIGDLYKTEVFDLCRHLNAAAGRELIPFAIIDKEPSAELAPDQRDTDSLPPYPVLDAILKQLIEGERLGEDERAAVAAAFARQQASEEGRALISRIKRMIARNEYKRRQAPPILRLRGRAFGSGRQMPIAAKYDF